MIELYINMIILKEKTINDIPKKYRREVIERLLQQGIDENGDKIKNKKQYIWG